MIITHSSDSVNNSGLATGRFRLEENALVYKLMYTHLYEDSKEHAVVQELAANAADAHKMAGCEDTPINIKLPTSLSPELIISDKGVGMSREVVENLFTTYGASTKRDSNDEIGGFGFGSKSPLAISDAYTVETTHAGITTTIACYLDSGMPSFSVFTNGNVGKQNGTVITIPVADKSIQSKLAEACEYLFLLWKVPPIIEGLEEDVKEVIATNVYENTENYAVVRSSAYKNHSGYGYYGVTLVAVGPYTYRIPRGFREALGNKLDILSNFNPAVLVAKQGVETYRATTIFKFEIGELSLSPSRLIIDDTPENLVALTAKIDEYYNIYLRESAKFDYKSTLEMIKYLNENSTKIKDVIKSSTSETIIETDKLKLVDFLEKFHGCSTSIVLELCLINLWSKRDCLFANFEDYADKAAVNVFDNFEICRNYCISWTYRSDSRIASLLPTGAGTYGRYMRAPDIPQMLVNTSNNALEAVIKELNVSILVAERNTYSGRCSSFSTSPARLSNIDLFVIGDESLKRACYSVIRNSDIKRIALVLTVDANAAVCEETIKTFYKGNNDSKPIKVIRNKELLDLAKSVTPKPSSSAGSKTTVNTPAYSRKSDKDIVCGTWKVSSGATNDRKTVTKDMILDDWLPEGIEVLFVVTGTKKDSYYTDHAGAFLSSAWPSYVIQDQVGSKIGVLYTNNQVKNTKYFKDYLEKIGSKEITIKELDTAGSHPPTLLADSVSDIPFVVANKNKGIRNGTILDILFDMPHSRNHTDWEKHLPHTASLLDGDVVVAYRGTSLRSSVFEKLSARLQYAVHHLASFYTKGLDGVFTEEEDLLIKEAIETKLGELYDSSHSNKDVSDLPAA